MRQPVGQVRFKFGVRGIAETCIELGVVIGQNFSNPFFLITALSIIKDIRIEKSGQFQPGISGFNQAIIIDRFGNGTGGKNGMIFFALAKSLPILQHIANHRINMFRFLILHIGHIILNAFLIFAVLIILARHRHIVHKAVVDFLFRFTGEHFAFIRCFGLLQGDGAAQITVFKGADMEGVKAQHIFIANAVCDGIAVQLIAENGRRSGIFPGVFFLNRRAGKAKEKRIGESVLNGEQHIAKSGAVGFVNNKH